MKVLIWRHVGQIKLLNFELEPPPPHQPLQAPTSPEFKPWYLQPRAGYNNGVVQSEKPKQEGERCPSAASQPALPYDTDLNSLWVASHKCGESDDSHLGVCVKYMIIYVDCYDSKQVTAQTERKPQPLPFRTPQHRLLLTMPIDKCNTSSKENICGLVSMPGYFGCANRGCGVHKMKGWETLLKDNIK